MQVDAVFQDDGAGQINPLRHHQRSPALLVERRDGLAERLRIGRHAVGDSAEIGQRYLPVGNHNPGRRNGLAIQHESGTDQEKKENGGQLLHSVLLTLRKYTQLINRFPIEGDRVCRYVKEFVLLL